MRDAIGKFPARRLTPDEHALRVDWLAASGDVTSAYVSNRSSDDPALKKTPDYHCDRTRRRTRRRTIALCSRTKRAEYLDCIRIRPKNASTPLSDPARRVEFHSTSPCGHRLGSRGRRLEAGPAQVHIRLQQAQGRIMSVASMPRSPCIAHLAQSQANVHFLVCSFWSSSCRSISCVRPASPHVRSMVNE
jgi:hypothetical protein